MNKTTTLKGKQGPSKSPKNLGTHGSIKLLEQKRRQVYKPVLENPYIRSNNWPYIDKELGADIVELLYKSLEPIGKYKKYKSASEKSNISMEIPELLPFTTIGFNSTNKALERMSMFNRKESVVKPELIISMVFVCKVDITPTLLTQHLPMLTFMALSKETPVKLVQLPRNSMDKLSNAVGHQLTGIIGISTDAPGVSVLRNLVYEKVQDVSIPWMELLNFQVPNIKLLVTSQPIVAKKNDQKAAKKLQKSGKET